MSAAQHTPGPWFADLSAETVTSADGNIVVYELNTNEADACLIAAAPDLLEALTKLLDMHERCDAGFAPHVELRFAIRDMARAVLAKATGETK